MIIMLIIQYFLDLGNFIKILYFYKLFVTSMVYRICSYYNDLRLFKSFYFEFQSSLSFANAHNIMPISRWYWHKVD